MTCPYPDCSWRAITASESGARTAYLKHVVEAHAEDGAASIDWFERSPGYTSTWRTHETGQLFIVLDGDFVLHTEATSTELSTSDSMQIAAGERHYTENPGERPCVGLRVSAPEHEFSTGSP